MASQIIYPPTIDSSLPAFQAGKDSYCRVYFSLSKFNSTADFSNGIYVHVSIVKQDTNMNVINLIDDEENGIYRATGIILNMRAYPVVEEDNLFYFDITNDNLSSASKGYNGWIPGWKYKIQIRLSTVSYPDENLSGQNDWLNKNSSNFSEWSTVCVTKAIGPIHLTIPPLEYDSEHKDESSSNSNSIRHTLYLSTLDFFGNIECKDDTSEVLYKYNLKLYDENNNLLEDSGDLFTDSFQNCNVFRYLCKYELQNNKNYNISFTYMTNNGYTETFKDSFDISLVQMDIINCSIYTVDNDNKGLLTNISSKAMEEDEGRIAIKLYSTNTNPYSGNICIRRASAKDDFAIWTDVKIIVVKDQVINNLPIIYDYSIESGVWYKYGVQSIDKDGYRGILIQNNPIMRDFEYSFLLGENDQQLKLMFNNTMSSYKLQVMDNKVETIGGIYPTITRNSALRYRIFPINGLISFWMDENNLFCSKRVIYKSEEVINLYNQYNKEKFSSSPGYSPEHNHAILTTADSPSFVNEALIPSAEPSKVVGNYQYDYIYERDFRKMVLDFLHDGKPKLFKSPTEGNVIVRLTDINCTPNQTLDRMIYEFAGTGNEIAESNNENYIKYGFLNPGEWSSDFSTYETKLGQIQMEFGTDVNIFNEIYKKYDSQGRNLAGYTKTIGNIHHLKITIEDKPLRIYNSARELVLGNNIELNGKTITIYNPQRVYEFDSRLIYTKDSFLYLKGDADNKVQTVKATIDFLYELQSEIYQEKQIQSKEIRVGVGQLFGEYKADTSLWNEIYTKYYIKWDTTFRALNSLSSIEIEANPGTVFRIKDAADLTAQYHEIGDTGLLDLYELSNIKELRYIGVRNRLTGEIEAKPANILLNYKYSLVKGTYKKG